MLLSPAGTCQAATAREFIHFIRIPSRPSRCGPWTFGLRHHYLSVPSLALAMTARSRSPKVARAGASEAIEASGLSLEARAVIIQQWSLTVINSGVYMGLHCTFCGFYERSNLSISKVRFLAMIIINDHPGWFLAEPHQFNMFNLARFNLALR